MITKAQLRRVKSLHLKKYREEFRQFIAEGPKVVNDLLRSPYRAVELFALEGFSPAVPGAAITVVSEKELGQLSALSAPNQVLGVFEIPPGREAPFKNPGSLRELVIALDDIRDPGNLGTILRIADWFGIKFVVCSSSCVDIYNPKVVQASMGSLGRVEVRCIELEPLLKGCGNVYGAVIGGKNIYKEKLPSEGVILIGSEANGISAPLLKHVTVKISIPGFSKGADSLNAAMACAVICSEFRRGAAGQ